MSTVQVKLLKPTFRLGARLKAYDSNGTQKTISYDSSKTEKENAMNAARALINKRPWNSQITAFGKLRNGDYVFILN